jgi:hypothetical protein
MEPVRVEFTTYDSSGNLVVTEFANVRAIPPGESRANASYADLYGTEERPGGESGFRTWGLR